MQQVLSCCRGCLGYYIGWTICALSSPDTLHLSPRLINMIRNPLGSWKEDWNMGGILDCGTHRACDNNIKSAVVKKQVLRLLSTVSVFATKTPGFNILKNVFLYRAINLLCGLLYFPFFFSRHPSTGSRPPPLPRRSQVFMSRGVG